VRTLFPALVLSSVLAGAAAADPGEVKVSGRIFARGEAGRFEGEPYVAEGSISSARAEIRYEWEWLRAVVEVEFRDGADLKDAYVRATHHVWRAQAGNFKEPISAIEMESGWDLPLTTRGLLHDLLSDRLQIGFRRPGLMGTWRGPGDLSPRVSLGAFQGTGADGQSQGDLLRSAARGSVEPGPVEVGVFFEHRDAEPVDGLGRERFWSVGTDAVLQLGGLRAWADFLLGTSWLDAIVADDDEATFLFARAIVAYRFGGEDGGRFYVEPYLMVGALDPDLDIRRDRIGEVAGGVNVGAWRRVRVQLEIEGYDGQRNTPAGYGVRDRLAFVGQIGAAF
jgi:hypothetical protein